MKDFKEPKNKKLLIKGGYYLVQSGNWSPSGFDIAEWDGKKFISETNQSDMTDYVEGFLALDEVSIV